MFPSTGIRPVAFMDISKRQRVGYRVLPPPSEKWCNTLDTEGSSLPLNGKSIELAGQVVNRAGKFNISRIPLSFKGLLENCFGNLGGPMILAYTVLFAVRLPASFRILKGRLRLW